MNDSIFNNATLVGRMQIFIARSATYGDKLNTRQPESLRYSLSDHHNLESEPTYPAIYVVSTQQSSIHSLVIRKGVFIACRQLPQDNPYNHKQPL